MEKTADTLTCDKLCRLCLSTRGETLPIFSSGSSSDESDPPLLASKIHACVSVEITEDDALPTQICKKCVSNVNNWHIFKRICDESQVKLQSWMNDGAEISQLGLRIKKEPSPEDADDDIVIDASYPGVELVERSSEMRLQPEGPPILASLGLAPRNEKSCADPRTDWNRVVAIQNLVERDEPVEGTDSADDVDFLKESEADSDSDQELEPSDGQENKSEYISKDGYMKWYKKPVKAVLTHNLKRKTISGTVGAASGIQTPMQAWSCLFTETMLDVIVDYTNEYIEKNYVLADFIGQSNENLITRVELKALLGILYLSGIMRPAYYNHAELWWADGCGLNVVQTAMSLDRFRFILKCLRFDDAETRDSRIAVDPVAPVRQIFDDFNTNCKQSYNVGRCAIIDEKFEPFKGSCPFRRSLKTESGTKTGIKMFCLVEADTFYTSNMEIAVDTNSSVTKTNQLNGIVKKLAAHLANSGVTLVTGPRLASLGLAKTVTDDLGMNFVGTLQASRKEIPATFVSKSRKSYSSLFGYSDSGATLLSYLHPKRRACVLLSTREDHYNSRKLHSNGAPQALVWYKQRRGAARVAAVLAGSYTCAKRCPRWPLAVFLSLLDVAAVNSQVLWLSNRPQADVIYRRNFVRSLALELISELLRSSGEKGSGSDLDPLLAIRGGPVKGATTADASVRKSKRCKLCPRNADRKTRIYCIACSAPICKEHYRQLCVCCALKF